MGLVDGGLKLLHPEMTKKQSRLVKCLDMPSDSCLDSRERTFTWLMDIVFCCRV